VWLSGDCEPARSARRGQYIGRVEAETADEAIRVAIEEFGLNPERMKRLVAQREGSPLFIA
jgi:hypothetical protein